MPGVSAKQKSVKDFFSVRTGVMHGQLADGAEEYLLCEDSVMGGGGVSCDNKLVSEISEQTVAELSEQNDIPGTELARIYQPRKYTSKMCQKGGEGGKNSDKLKGGSVAEISSIFLQEGVGGASKINNIATLTKDEPQNYRQKLAKFKSL